jgi:hypothetical protein
MILGFALAAYAIVANDSIQTLGTFLASNSKRPWWSLWIWISGIMVVTVTWGWIANGGAHYLALCYSPALSGYPDKDGDSR